MQPSLRVLHVDDDESVLDLTATHLERHLDAEVVSRTTVSAAIECLEDESGAIDCVVSDYALPEADGLALLEAVRRIDAHRPFIFYTATEVADFAAGAMRAGATGYVPKVGGERYSELEDRIVAAVGRHRASRPTAASERRLRQLAEQSNDVLWMFRADWEELVYVNSAVEDVFGIAPEQLRTQPRRFLSAIHPADRDRVRDAMDRLSAGESVTVEYRVNEAAAYGRWVWVNAEPVFDDAGDVETIVGFCRDITDRKRRERALAALNDVAVDLGTLETDEAVCERTIEASEHLLNFDLSIIDLEEDGLLSKVAISEHILEEEVTTMSVEDGIAGKTYRTGESMVVDEVSAHPEAEPQGPFESAISIPIGTHGVFQAVDEDPGAFTETDLELAELLISHTESALDRIEREGRLHRQNERLDEFSRIISHDLRNPLNVMQGCLSLASEDCSSPHLDDARRALERMSAIVEDTRMLAAEGETIDEPKPVDLESIARDCWAMVPTDDASLEVAAESRIRADPDRLRHVFENLFRNAIEHGGVDCAVRVGELDDGFFVEDDGAGIPDERRDSVMEMGHSGSDGSGYGLAIVRRIAEAHGWTVRVTDSPAGGARFEFVDAETAGTDRRLAE